MTRAKKYLAQSLLAKILFVLTRNDNALFDHVAVSVTADGSARAAVVIQAQTRTNHTCDTTIYCQCRPVLMGLSDDNEILIKREPLV